MNLKKMSTFEIQKELFEVAREIKRICDKNQISYYLGFGSLLGGMRDGGFIPWDDDMDFFILREDWIKFNNCLFKHLDKKKFFLINACTRKNYPYWSFITRVGVNGTYRKMDYFKSNEEFQSGIFVDIFVVENVLDNSRLLNIQQCALKMIDKLIVIKSMKTEYQSNLNLIEKVVGNFWGRRLTLETCNIIRNSIQISLTVYNAKKLLVPMGPNGKYPIEKTLYDKKWFEDKIEIPFYLIKEGKEIDKLMLTVPIEYEEILRKTYGNWRRRPKGKKPKGVSYWIKGENG